MATDEFGQPQDFNSSQTNGIPNLGGDTGDTPRDLFGNPLSQGPQALMNYDALLEGGELSIENGYSGAGGTGAPDVPASRFIQPVYGDELITHIQPVDAVIDATARTYNAIETLGGEIAETAAPMLQELGEAVVARSQELSGKAADSWNAPNNQLRAGLEERLANFQNRLTDLAQSDLVQQGIQGVTQAGKAAFEALKNAQYEFGLLQRAAAPFVEGVLEVATGANLASSHQDSFTLPPDAKLFQGIPYTWQPYTTRPEDTLSQIALDTLGTGSKAAYEFIAQHNGIQNPDKIFPGQEILIPVALVLPSDVASPVPTSNKSEQVNGFVIKDEFLAVAKAWNFGNPTSDVMTHSSGVRFQFFDHPSGRASVVSSEHGAFPLLGGIRNHYVNVAKGLNGVLGAPTSAEQGVGNGLVKQEFENGYITWKDGMAQAYNQDGGLLFQRPAYTPPSFRAGGGSNSGALLSTVDRDYFLQRPEFYTTGNIFAQSGFGSSLVSGTGSTEGNCTWYAHGRVMEMGGDPAALRSMRGNANQWHLQMSNGTRVLNAGEQPQIGDIAQWTRSGMNHVAVVEDVYDKGGQTYIKISESHYNTNFDGGANGTLHSVKEYTEGNPDRFIRVPGVSQGVESLSTAKAPSQKGSYEENFDARIYEDGSDIPTHNPELSIRQEGWDGSQHIQNSNETLYRVEVPNSKLESIGNFFSGLIGSSPKNEKEYIFTTSNYIYIDKLEQEAHKDGSVSISMKAYNPHPVDALIEIYDDKGQLVDIASKQISASKLPESLLDGFLDATLRYSTEDLGRGFTDIRNNTSPTELDVDLKPGQRLDISINSDAATLVNTIALVIDAVKYSPELFRSISPTFMDQVVESMDSFRIVEAAKMILMKEGLEIVRDSVIHSSKESTDWKDFLSSEGFKNLLSYLMSDVYKDMSFGISKHALEKAIDQGVMKLNPALGKIQESLYSITKSLNIVNRFTTMQKALDSNIESASFQIVPGSDQ